MFWNASYCEYFKVHMYNWTKHFYISCFVDLMRNPILQEKRQEHVTFQKYALELLERLSGKAKQASQDSEVSLVNIHRVSIILLKNIFKEVFQ